MTTKKTPAERDEELEALLAESGLRDEAPGAEAVARWEAASLRENRRLLELRPRARAWAFELAKVAAVAAIAFGGGVQWRAMREPVTARTANVETARPQGLMPANAVRPVPSPSPSAPRAKTP